ncbi:MAG: site-2 protease family protein [Planctomycetota bacterium]
MLAVGAPAVMLAAFAMPEWVSSVWSFVLLALGFSLVIFVHELGHFMAAKWAGVRVDQFAIGFGKELVGFTKGETRYSMNILPLGGYVKMLGQEDFVVDKSGELKVKHDPGSFTNKSIGQRMVIISAGVIMNLIFSTVAFAVVSMVGRYQPPPVVGSVVQNSPAARAGLQTGDRIVKINGDDLRSWADLTTAVVLSNQDEPLELDVERNGKLLEPKPRVLPEFKKAESVRQLGISAGSNRRVAIPSIWEKEEPGVGEVLRHDELYKLMLPSGEAKEFKDLGVFHRAMVEARGAPVDVMVRRPTKPEALSEEALLSGSAEIESTEVRASVRALWIPGSHVQGDTVTGSLLGLVPRLTIFVTEEKKSFDVAGAKTGDVITKIGSNAYPSWATLKSTIEENAGKEVAVEVRRPFAANQGLTGRTVSFVCDHREEFISAARKGTAAGMAVVNEKAKAAGLTNGEREKLTAKLEDVADAPAWRRWMEAVDVHALKPLMPKKPFTLFGKSPPAPVEAIIHSVDENHLVVADVVDAIEGRPTPAKSAGIPVGSVILSVDGKALTQWWQLSEAFRLAAGKSVEIGYRTADEFRTAKMSVPVCITSALNLGPGTRITKIDGKINLEVKNAEGQLEEVALPDYRAVKAILESCKGRTVPVEYVTLQGQSGNGTFAVTAENTDPWLQRIQFAQTFYCQPLVERFQISNPLAAAGEGFRQAYGVTLQTVKTIEHMLITRKVGVDKVSGPVGIFRIGTRVADQGLLNLLFFLALISANLAVLNFLPMPIVDGGLFLFLILEKIRGEPVSIKTQVATQIIGIALIATLFVLVTYQDIKNWITGA